MSFPSPEEKVSKKLKESLPPEVDLSSPASKDQVEMYVSLKNKKITYFSWY